MDDRLTELELRYTEQERLLQELSEVLFLQQREIDLLRLEVDSLKRRVAESQDIPTIGAAEKPPHF